MVQVAKRIIRALSLLYGFSITCQTAGNLFVLDYLYPQRYFYQLESYAKELWASLDVILASDSFDVITTHTIVEHVQQEYSKVEHAFEQFIRSSGSSIVYLQDDIEYIALLMQHISVKVICLIEKLEPENWVILEHIVHFLHNARCILLCDSHNNIQRACQCALCQNPQAISIPT